MAFGARVSIGVQLAGSAAGAAGVVDAGAAEFVVVRPAVPLPEVFVPGLAQPAARVHAASAARPKRAPRS